MPLGAFSPLPVAVGSSDCDDVQAAGFLPCADGFLAGDYGTRIVASSEIVVDYGTRIDTARDTREKLQDVSRKSEKPKEPTAQESGEDESNASRRTANNISLCNKSQPFSPFKRNCTRIISHPAPAEYNREKKTRPRAAAGKRQKTRPRVRLSRNHGGDERSQ